MAGDYHNTTIYLCPDCGEYYDHLSEADRCCQGFGESGYECKKCGKTYQWPEDVTCCINK